MSETEQADFRLHPSCVTDLNRPTFDADWQRRAFGLAVALSEFGHYPWGDFQRELIAAIGGWEEAPVDARGRWEYYEHWVTALRQVVAGHGMLEDGYVNPEDRDEHPEPAPEPAAEASAGAAPATPAGGR